MAILYQVWVPAVVFAHCLGLIWLVISVGRLFGAGLQLRLRKLLAEAVKALQRRKAHPTEDESPSKPRDVEAQVRPDPASAQPVHGGAAAVQRASRVRTSDQCMSLFPLHRQRIGCRRTRLRIRP